MPEHFTNEIPEFKSDETFFFHIYARCNLSISPLPDSYNKPQQLSCIYKASCSSNSYFFPLQFQLSKEAAYESFKQLSQVQKFYKSLKLYVHTPTKFG